MRLPSTSTVFFASGCSVIGCLRDRRACRASAWSANDHKAIAIRCDVINRQRASPSARSTVRSHENRQAEAGEMVQRLIDPDQRPEPWVLVLLRHAKRRGAKPLGAVDRDVDRKIDQGDEPELRRDNQD